MRTSRREFVQISAAAGAGLLLAGRGTAWAFYQSPTTIPLFGTNLRGVGPGGIPVAAPDTVLDPVTGLPVNAPAPVTGVTHYTINIKQFPDPGVCPTLGQTTLWGYDPQNPLGGGAQPQRHLGGILVAQRGVPIQVTFRNNLPNVPIVPVDATLFGVSPQANRMAVHLHGGFVPWISDGGPFDWFDPNGLHGLSFLNNVTLNPGAAANEAEYFYPNNQSARMMWYHDHAVGITRTNAYSGVASAYLIRDTFEANLQNLGLPPFIETSVLGGTTVQELPLVFQDKIFIGSNLALMDPTWPVGLPNTPGSLWYAHTYERNRWRMSGNVSGGNLKTNLPLPDPSCIPEFFGDTMLVNGTSYPKVTVEARRYRFRILNACNARFMNLQLFVGDASGNGVTLNPVTGIPTNLPYVWKAPDVGMQNQAAVLQIGTEGGFLSNAVAVPTNLPFNPVTLTGSLIMAPAERADLLIDFTGYEGQSIILYSDAPAPFPVGDPRNDYFPLWNVKGNPVNALTPNGFGPNTRVMMRFDVVAATGAADVPLAILPGFSFAAYGIDPPLGAPTFTRPLTLNETFDPYGRLIQLLGTNVVPAGAKTSAGFGQAYANPATEVIKAGTTEMWEIYNLTGDVHPIHFHLVNVQVINRQPFQVSSMGGGQNITPNFTGPAVPPDPNELGWKETVRMNPGQVTRVMMRFDLPIVPFAVPASPRTTGNEYVWHCHILEHEEHDMMRPLVVI